MPRTEPKRLTTASFKNLDDPLLDPYTRWNSARPGSTRPSAMSTSPGRSKRSSVCHWKPTTRTGRRTRWATPILCFGWVRHIRRRYAARRRRLQKAGRHRTLKRLEQREQRIVRRIVHILSKTPVAFAKKHNSGIRMEDLMGLRNTNQHKATKSQADQNRDCWPCFSERCGYQGHPNHNAARDIGTWLGLACPVVLQAPRSGVHGTPLSWVSQ